MSEKRYDAAVLMLQSYQLMKRLEQLPTNDVKMVSYVWRVWHRAKLRHERRVRRFTMMREQKNEG